MDEFDFDFVWTGYYFQPACRACEQCMPNGPNKCAWCQLSGVAWQWEATGFCLFCGCKKCDKRGLTGVGGGDGGLAHEGMDDRFFEWWGRGKSMMLWGGMFLFLLFLYLRWHEKEMHVREMVREWKDKERQMKKVLSACFPISMSLFSACVLCVPSPTAWKGP